MKFYPITLLAGLASAALSPTRETCDDDVGFEFPAPYRGASNETDLYDVQLGSVVPIRFRGDWDRVNIGLMGRNSSAPIYLQRDVRYQDDNDRNGDDDYVGTYNWTVGQPTDDGNSNNLYYLFVENPENDDERCWSRTIALHSAGTGGNFGSQTNATGNNPSETNAADRTVVDPLWNAFFALTVSAIMSSTFMS